MWVSFLTHPPPQLPRPFFPSAVYKENYSLLLQWSCHVVNFFLSFFKQNVNHKLPRGTCTDNPSSHESSEVLNRIQRQKPTIEKERTFSCELDHFQQRKQLLKFPCLGSVVSELGVRFWSNYFYDSSMKTLPSRSMLLIKNSTVCQRRRVSQFLQLEVTAQCPHLGTDSPYRSTSCKITLDKHQKLQLLCKWILFG